MSVERHIDQSSPMHQFVIGRMNDWQLGGLDIYDRLIIGQVTI